MKRFFRRLEWTRDNDHQWGPFLYARGKYDNRNCAIVLSSGDGDDYAGCKLRFTLLGHTFIIGLPQILNPAYKIKRYQNSSYIEFYDRQYGFSLNEGYLSCLYGEQTHDSCTNKQKGWFLPWTQWRHVRISFYDSELNHYKTVYDSDGWGAQFEARDNCPTVKFVFRDFDGEELVATTNIQEREWRFGTGKFKWLSVFRKPMIERSLDITFSGETGKRKGSWKGGTVGHSIKILPNENHENVFRRYCDENNMTFVRKKEIDVIEN